MRILIFMMLLLGMAACKKHLLQLPEQPAIAGLAKPILLQTDTNVVELGDYFLDPMEIKKITPADGLKIYWDRKHQKLAISSVDTVFCLSYISIRCGKYDYNIPVIRPGVDVHLQISAAAVRGDTIFVRSSAPVVEWAVYWQNYRLDPPFLCPKKDSLGIILPVIADQLRYAKLRIWAKDSMGISNDVVIPLRRGKAITAVEQLNSTDKESAFLYGLGIDGKCETDEMLSDSMGIVFHSPVFATIGRQMERGYFHDLGVNTLCLSFLLQTDSLWEDLATLTEMARQQRINVLWDTVASQVFSQTSEPYWEKGDWALFDEAVPVFARSNMGFEKLTRWLDKEFRYLGMNGDRVHPSGCPQKKRFVVCVDEYGSSLSEERQDTLCRKLFQWLAFNATIPGIPMIYGGDEVGWPKQAWLPRAGDSWMESQLNLKRKVGTLNKFRSRQMALLYGSFIPLRIEKRLCAYMRTYLGQHVLVVFNKGNETVTLKLDLPLMQEEENFQALFGSRFSYDKAKMILDVPANGVEIFYNE